MWTEYYMSPAACEIMNIPPKIPWLQTITGDYRAWLRLHQAWRKCDYDYDYDYDYIKNVIDYNQLRLQS